MTVGTRSLIFGVHQIFWHPITVFLAWCRLYGLPTWRELVCIIVHDWGYIGCANMDGPEGQRHPELGARIARAVAGRQAGLEALDHSRHYAHAYGRQPSKLCWADKLSILYDPAPFYLLRAWLSGELEEYRMNCQRNGFMPRDASNWEWFRTIRCYFARITRDRNGKPFWARGAK